MSEELLKFHHLGIASVCIEDSIEFIKRNFEIEYISEQIFDELQDGTLCIVSVKNHPDIELIAGNVVKNLIPKNRLFYHICYEVENIDLAVKRLTSESCVLVIDIKEAILFQNRRVCFLQSPIGLIELVEKD